MTQFQNKNLIYSHQMLNTHPNIILFHFNTLQSSKKGCFGPVEMKCEPLHLEWERLPFSVLVYAGFFSCIFNYKDA